jgi:hypothetical protein
MQLRQLTARSLPLPLADPERPLSRGMCLRLSVLIRALAIVLLIQLLAATGAHAQSVAAPQSLHSHQLPAHKPTDTRVGLVLRAEPHRVFCRNV